MSEEPKHNGEGFTLIEMLVVMAVIAILASILFPVFAQTREKARAGSCVSNLRQLGVAFRMYANDYNGFMPYFWCNTLPDPAPIRSLDSYIKNDGVFYCPSDPISGRYYYTSYGCNFRVWGDLIGHNPVMQLDKVPARPIPGSFIWYAWNRVYILDEWNNPPSSWQDKNKNRITDSYEWHIKGCNLLCSDASVKFIKGYDFFTGNGV